MMFKRVMITCFCLLDKLTYLGQKFCVVVYPAEDKKNEECEEMELKEQSAPLSEENRDTAKSADC